MKIALLTNYPWVDQVNWKKDLVAMLQEEGHEVEVHYGKAGPGAHLTTFLKLRRYANAHDDEQSSARRSSNLLYFLRQGVRVRVHRDLNHPRVIQQIAERGYDYHITALDQILSSSFLATISSVLNVHYGKLPEVKGMDAIEWTVLETGELAMTLHYLADKVDTGGIVHVEPIPFDSSMSMAACRRAIHAKIPEVYVRFFRGEFSQVSENSKGKLYSQMHPDVYRLLRRS